MYCLNSSVGDVELLDWFQEMNTKMVKTLKHLSYEESLSRTVQVGAEEALGNPTSAQKNGEKKNWGLSGAA